VKLAAGVYMAKISVWDKDMLHPYVVRDEDVIRLVDNGIVRHVESVFLPEINWEILK